MEHKPDTHKNEPGKTEKKDKPDLHDLKPEKDPKGGNYGNPIIGGSGGIQGGGGAPTQGPHH